MEKLLVLMIPRGKMRHAVIPPLTIAVVLGGGFILRGITLNSLPFSTKQNVTIVSILPEDNRLSGNVLDKIINVAEPEGKGNLRADKDYFAYLMPADYIMQGMIANTGSDFHLMKKHHTVSMITEWVFHPFRHLRASPTLHMAKMHHVNPAFARKHHCPIGIRDPEMKCEECPYRRVILVEVDNSAGKRLTGKGLLSFNTTRIPVCYLDINTVTGDIVSINPVDKNTAWRDIPTPAI